MSSILEHQRATSTNYQGAATNPSRSLSMSETSSVISQQFRNPEETSVHLELRIHATGLPRSGIRKLPSCWAQVDLLESSIATARNRRHWGKTEIVPNSSHPQWTTTLPLEYKYGTQVYFSVTVLTHSEKFDNIIGGAIFEVSDILGTRTKTKRLPKGGCLFCTLERAKAQVGESVYKCRFQASLKASKLQWGLDTYLEIAKKEKSTSCSTWITIYRSPPVYGSTSPTFDPTQLLGIDWGTSLRISIWVYKQNRVLGTCETTWKYLFDAQTGRNVQEESPKDLILGKPGANRTEIGKLRVVDAKIGGENDDDESDMSFSQNPEYATVEIMSLPSAGAGGGECMNGHASFYRASSQPTFQDYVNGGLQLDVVVAIDYTSSNGDPRRPESLHYLNPDSLNDYEEVISSVGDALASYSQSKQFPVYGFGAKFDGTVRHIFQCGSSKEVKGVNGILEAYRSVFKSEITMSGPTVLDQVIQAAAMRTHKFQQMHDHLRYCVLLIITDGIVNDLQATKRKLGAYSNLPMSVIIAGVGRADFSAMYILTSAIPGTRLNTTFVTFRQHQQGPTSLAKAALKDLPEQIVEYFKSHVER